MKRVRKSKASTSDEAVSEPAAPDAPPAAPERRSGLLSECWADLRGRPRPMAEPAWEEEKQSASVAGGVGLDEDGMRRLHARYGASTN